LDAYICFMIEVSKDNQMIYFLLEKADQLLSGFSIDQVIAFEYEDDFYLVTYTASNRNFVSFKACYFRQDKNVLPLLLEKVQESEGLILPLLLDKGIKLIENKIHSDNDRFYFDAH
jgi:hypothetical protein